MSTTLHIKNMVCDRCIRTVRSLLTELGATVMDVQLGKAEIEGDLDPERVRKRLMKEGFDLVEDRKYVLVEGIKSIIIDLIYNKGLHTIKVPVSEYLASALARDYHYLSTLFSQLESITIEKYLLLQKIERTKELLVYDELTLTQIAHNLGYSSVAYLSGQFKQTTGFTPSEFKKLKSNRRLAIDTIS